MKAIFKLKQQGQVNYYIIEEFMATGLVEQAFTTKIGGVSWGDFAELNLGIHTADNQEDVIRNRQLTAKVLNSSLAEWVSGEQIHSNQVAIVSQAERGRGALKENQALRGIDALVTDQPNVLLTSFYADCTPLLFLDPSREVIALAHAGWKGTLAGIAKNTVRQMQLSFASQVEDILVGIGPAIGACCYQVGAEVADLFKADSIDADKILKRDRADKYLLDLQKANKLQLLKLGLKESNIISSNLCTYCKEELFFSYRREEGRTGRMASLLKLK